MTEKLVRAVGGLWPFPLLPVFVWLTAEGFLNFGGGEKDILLVIPLGVFGFIYSIAYFVALRFKLSVPKSMGAAFFTSLLLVFIIGFVLRVYLGLSSH
jgi:hypothetical protein